jgi:V8-like Glu-specific endopeptidase
MTSLITIVPDSVHNQPIAINKTDVYRVIAKPFNTSVSPFHLSDMPTPIYNESDSNGTVSFPARQQDATGLGSPLTRDVFGEDNRETVLDTTSYPYSAIGKVQTASKQCTGTMIGRRLMLTALHCVEWDSNGDLGWMSFTPGYNNGEAPFDTAIAARINWADDDVASIFKDDGSLVTDDEAAYDYAVVELEEDIGDYTGWMGVKTYSTDWNNERYWNHVGYPADIDGSESPQKVEGGMVIDVLAFDWTGNTGYVLATDVDTYKGQSGGPLYGEFDGDYYIVGVMSYGSSIHNGFSGGPSLSSLVSYAYDMVNDATSMPTMEQEQDQDQDQDQPEEDNLDDLQATLDGLAEDLAALQAELDQTP